MATEPTMRSFSSASQTWLPVWLEPAGEFSHAGRDLAFEELAEARVARVERGVHLGDAADHAGLVAGVDRDRIGCAGPERLSRQARKA